MPNGMYIPVEVSSDATLTEVKDDLWEEARKYPLLGLLKEQSLYNFQCINSMADNEEIVNESRRICDIKPFCNILKVVECKGDKAEQVLNTQIGHLIGKGLHDFDALKSLEVNEFRWRMKIMTISMNHKKKSMSMLDKISYHFPCDVIESEETELPLYLQAKLRDGNMIVTIRIDMNSETNFSFSIAHSTTPSELLTIALQKNVTLTGNYPFNPDMAQDYVLKLSGRKEYLIGDHPLSRYLCIRELLTKEILPSFVVVPIECVAFEPENIYADLPDLESKRTLRNSSTLKRKVPTTSSWTIDELFSFRIDAVSRLNCDESDVGIQVGLFHGNLSDYFLLSAQDAQIGFCFLIL